MARTVQVPNIDGGRLASSFAPQAAAIVQELVEAVRVLKEENAGLRKVVEDLDSKVAQMASSTPGPTFS